MNYWRDVDWREIASVLWILSLESFVYAIEGTLIGERLHMCISTLSLESLLQVDWTSVILGGSQVDS